MEHNRGFFRRPIINNGYTIEQFKLKAKYIERTKKNLKQSMSFFCLKSSDKRHVSVYRTYRSDFKSKNDRRCCREFLAANITYHRI